MQPNPIKVTVGEEEYILTRIGDKFFMNGKEIVQKTFRELNEDGKDIYEEQKQSGYTKQEALFITNLIRLGVFDSLDEDYSNILIVEIMLLMFHNDPRIFGKNIHYHEDMTEDENGPYTIITLSCMGKEVKLNPEASFKDMILDLIS
jgi:hypothetical protein